MSEDINFYAEILLFIFLNLFSNLIQECGSDKDDWPARGHHREAEQRDHLGPARSRRRIRGHRDGVVLETRSFNDAGAKKEVTAVVGNQLGIKLITLVIWLA